MFISEELIYIQLQKTASSHIARILPRFFEGEIVGEHNSATPKQLNSQRVFISSIRNPWDWYLSLWTFGIIGGRVRKRLTMEPTIKSFLKNISLDHFEKERARAALFRSVYDDNRNVESFRSWLKMIHSEEYSGLFKKGYTSVSPICGIMTFRYLNLCCKNTQKFKQRKAISNLDDLVQFDKDNCYIDFFIRQESLEDDFCEAIEKVRPLTQEEKDSIYGAKKTNTSKRSLSISDYYDQECIDLVQNRDQLLVDKFDYSFPSAP